MKLSRVYTTRAGFKRQRGVAGKGTGATSPVHCHKGSSIGAGAGAGAGAGKGGGNLHKRAISGLLAETVDVPGLSRIFFLAITRTTLITTCRSVLSDLPAQHRRFQLNLGAGTIAKPASDSFIKYVAVNVEGV